MSEIVQLTNPISTGIHVFIDKNKGTRGTVCGTVDKVYLNLYNNKVYLNIYINGEKCCLGYYQRTRQNDARRHSKEVQILGMLSNFDNNQLEQKATKMLFVC